MIIMRNIILITVLSLIAAVCSAQKKHALLIGVGDYPKESGWRAISGDKDIPLVKEALFRQGFKENEITSLINAQATKAAIVQAMENLATTSDKGDLVYIHFSGHGQQISDVDGDEKVDETSDSFDEAWIPYDAHATFKIGVYEGEKHLIDDEINILLYAIRKKIGDSGKIVVIADACHSGGGSRSLNGVKDDVIMRGWEEEFVIPKDLWGQKSKDTKKNQREKNDPWLYVGACDSYQSNYEYRAKDGKSYGVLTYLITHDQSIFSMKDYKDAVNDWDKMLGELREKPTQTITPSGQPSKISKTLF